MSSIELTPPAEVGGVIACVAGATAGDLVAELTPTERALATAMGPRRAREWALGRGCLRRAIKTLAPGFTDDLLANDRGAPHVTAALRVSLSHKDDLAVAWAQLTTHGPAGRWHLGIDLETLAPPRQPIEARVLTARERDVLPSQHESRQAMVKTIFALKEAAYKALDPFVRRHVGFAEAEVERAPAGLWRIKVAAHAEIQILARVQGLPDHVIAMAWATETK